MGRESFEKREREKKRQQRSAAKRERREARAEPAVVVGGEVNSDELMERFRVLSERYAVGSVTEEQYEAQRVEIFSELGLDPNTR